MLRRLRERAGLTQEQLAGRAGLSAKAISALERGERRHPYPHTVRALAAALGLSRDEHAVLQAGVPSRPRRGGELPTDVGSGERPRTMRVVSTQVTGFTEVIGRALLDILAPQDSDWTHDPVQAVHAVLANRVGWWLLVLDDVADPVALRGLLPAAGAGDVIITSRAGTWPDPRILLPVRSLAEPDAVELVTSLSGDRDRRIAAELADELGGLPLALAQAGCYVGHNALDLAGYLALYRQRRAEMHHEGNVPDYPATVATTWQLAFARLSPSARALLNLLCWYAPDTIPLDRLFSTTDMKQIELPEPVEKLLRPLLADELHRHRATAELVAYGLLTPAGTHGQVTAHRLVQAVTADQLAADTDGGSWITAAAILLAAACPHPPATAESTSAWQRLHTHVRTLIEALQPDHPDTLSLRDTVANWSGEVGEVTRARELYTMLVEDMVRVFGPDHRHTLVARLRLAEWMGEDGAVAQARKLATALVEDMVRVFGPDHRHTLRARATLARWTGEAGKAVQAREMFAALVDDERRVFGSDDRDTLLARANLARWTARAGDMAQARKMCIELLEDTVRILGLDDEETRVAGAALAYWTGEVDDPAQAREVYAAVVEDEARVADGGCAPAGPGVSDRFSTASVECRSLTSLTSGGAK